MRWPSRVISFGDFRFDPSAHRLWRGTEEIVLRPKATALLGHLLRHSGEVVTKQQLLDAVWADTSVSDAVLKVSISEIRRALGDNGHGSRLIETRYGRGYRMTAAIDGRDGEPPSIGPELPLVARHTALDTLGERLGLAIEGARQTVFVTGEPGSGKTTLVEAFASRALRRDVWVACGHAVRHQGPEEPFEPVLEALNHLARQAGLDALVPLFRAHGPAWLKHLAWSSSAAHALADSESSRGRMLREMTETVAALTADRPLLLVLEDLHWADCSTLDLVAFLARPTEPARLLIVATAQPFDALAASHPLRAIKQELQVHRRSTELPLSPFDVADVASYLRARFPDLTWPVELVENIHCRTEGNPLYVTGVIDDLVRRGVFVPDCDDTPITARVEEAMAEVPAVVRELTLMNLDTLESADRRILEAASVAGREFSAAALAAILGEDALPIEERCEQLARRQQYIQPAGNATRPDGRITARFRFIHGFAQQVLSQGLVPRLRSRFQLRAEQYHAGSLEAPARRRVGHVAESRPDRRSPRQRR
jgi:predicted ATPase/DNA-binding winged helix-turn-helix (wHTH) protein